MFKNKIIMQEKKKRSILYSAFITLTITTISTHNTLLHFTYQYFHFHSPEKHFRWLLLQRFCSSEAPDTSESSSWKPAPRPAIQPSFSCVKPRSPTLPSLTFSTTSSPQASTSSTSVNFSSLDLYITFSLLLHLSYVRNTSYNNCYGLF